MELSGEELISQYDSLNEEELTRRIRHPMPKSQRRKLCYYGRKREREKLTEEDLVRLLRLADLSEAATVERVACMINLARRQQVLFDVIAKEFGFDHPRYQQRGGRRSKPRK